MKKIRGVLSVRPDKDASFNKTQQEFSYLLDSEMKETEIETEAVLDFQSIFVIICLARQLEKIDEAYPPAKISIYKSSALVYQTEGATFCV